MYSDTSLFSIPWSNALADLAYSSRKKKETFGSGGELRHLQDDQVRLRPDLGTEDRHPADHHQLRALPEGEQLFRGGVQGLREGHRHVQVAQRVRHLEHVPGVGVYQTLLFFVNLLVPITL